MQAETWSNASLKSEFAPYQARGIIISDDATWMETATSYLIGYYSLRTCPLSNMDAISEHFESPRCQFVILAGKDPRRLLEVLAWIRSRSNIAVLVVGGPASEEERVATLECGADDYLINPIGFRELLARIRAILRHAIRNRKKPRIKKHASYYFEGWEYSPCTRRLTNPHGIPSDLSRAENAVLMEFLRAPRHILTRDDLLTALRLHESISDRSIDVRVLRLRRKLESCGVRRGIIRTERGFGYSFRPAVETQQNFRSRPLNSLS
jgi:two-component system, OmpR family, response regulator